MTRLRRGTFGARPRLLAMVGLAAVVALSGCTARSQVGLVPNTAGPSAGVSTPPGSVQPYTGPVAGVAIALGKPAIVISPCAGDVVREAGAFAKDSSDATKNVWLVDASKARRLVVIGLGVQPAGYTTVVPYSSKLNSASLTGKVIIAPATGKSFTVETVDSFGDAVDNQILVKGQYLTFNQFMQQYSLCNQRH